MESSTNLGRNQARVIQGHSCHRNVFGNNSKAAASFVHCDEINMHCCANVCCA